MHAAVATLALCLAAAGTAFAAAPGLRVVDGVTADGRATELWLAVLARRLPAADYRAVAPLVRPPSENDRAWARLIRARAPEWERRHMDELAPLFAPVRPPRDVVVVLGNRGASDAFTHDPTTVGFDLAALQAEYGDAADPANAERLDRLFRHEYVHLLQKAWLAEHQVDAASPLAAAAVELWGEGLGNHHSMSDRWRARAGVHSAAARAALDELEPRLVARLAALACAPPEAAAPLTADLSWGRFDQKWGALTVALWLEAEASRSPAALRDFAVAGPDGVWDLARRQLAPALARVLDEARRAGELCASRY